MNRWNRKGLFLHQAVILSEITAKTPTASLFTGKACNWHSAVHGTPCLDTSQSCSAHYCRVFSPGELLHRVKSTHVSAPPAPQLLIDSCALITSPSSAPTQRNAPVTWNQQTSGANKRGSFKVPCRSHQDAQMRSKRTAQRVWIWGQTVAADVHVKSVSAEDRAALQWMRDRECVSFFVSCVWVSCCSWPGLLVQPGGFTAQWHPVFMFPYFSLSHKNDTTNRNTHWGLKESL